MAATHGESHAGLNAASAGDRGAGLSSDRPGEAWPLPSAGGDSLWALLWSQPQQFEFLAALRVLALEGIGPAAGAVEGGLRFRVAPTLAFPPSDLCDLSPSRGARWRAEMTVAFLGLIGPSGVLPRHYTLLAYERLRRGDRALCDFLDLFHQRLLTLFAAAAEKYRFCHTYERAEQRAAQCRQEGPQRWRNFQCEQRAAVDLFSQILLDLCGLGTPLLRLRDSVRTAPVRRTEVGDEVFRFFAGGLAQRHRNAAMLAQMITARLGTAVQIVPLVGQWIRLPSEYQTCLRGSSAAGGGNNRGPSATAVSPPRLGQNTVLGARIRDLEGRFRVRLGPLKLEQFLRLLPGGDRFRWLAHLVRLYVGPALDFEFQAVLAGEEVPWCQLGAAGASAPRLGWNTWIRSRPFTRPVDDAIFQVPDAVSMGQ